MSYRIFSIALILTLALSTSARADIVTDWNLIAVQTTKLLSSSSNTAPRALAITHIAIHNALQAIDKTHAPYPADAAPLEFSEPLSREAAALGAAHYVLSVLVSSKKSELTAKLRSALETLAATSTEKKNGVALGVAAAAAILQLRNSDKATLTEAAYTGSTDVGKWRPTGVDVNNVPVPGIDPHFRNVVPFAIPSGSEYRAPLPPALDSATYLADFAEVKKLGAAATTDLTTLTRSANQTEIAKFWENPSHIPFNAIARQIAKTEVLSLSDSARLFALLNIALADARIALWDSKYFYSTWRPTTAIVTGDGVEDDGTASDPDWLPFLTTPAHPEYPSGHSGTGSAAVAVLAAWFGDEVPYTVASDSLPEVTRSYTTLSQAASENGRSRIYGGIHFQYANLAGQTVGTKVGAHVVETQLLELPAVADAGVEGPDAGSADAGPGNAGEDAGVLADAGSAGELDSGSEDPDADNPSEDAGASEDDETSDSCAIASPGTSHGGLSGLALAALATTLIVRSRRRSTRS